MKVEKQVCSLALSKQLKELGYPQEGIYGWYRKRDLTIYSKGKIDYYIAIISSHGTSPHCNCDNDTTLIAVAPTVAELGEWLPLWIETKYSDGTPETLILNYSVILDKPNGNRVYHVGYMAGIHGNGNVLDHWVSSVVNEAEARGLMAKWLLENHPEAFGERR